MLSDDITVTGLPTGYAVRLYNSNGVLIASAVSVAGTATLALASVAGFDTNSNPDTTQGGFAGSVRVYTDSSYALQVNTLHLDDIWGGDPFEYTADTIPTAIGSIPKVERTPTRGLVDVQIWNKAGTRCLSTITDDGAALYRHENLELTKNRNGDATLVFDLKREPVSEYWEDLEDSNVVRAFIDGEYGWEGDIEGVERKVGTESLFTVQCLGWPAKLKINGTDDDPALNLAPGEAGSTYMVDHIVTDTDL
jgi:hypothetical protein